MQENKPVLVVGLGNPGDEYKNTRHNVGFMAVKYLAGADASWRAEHDALTFRGDINGQRIIFALPQTFMNDSGRAVSALMRFYKIPLDNVVVIHDDMDIKLGNKREKIGGSSAGHNGIKSIDAAVGCEYRRIRIGIGHPRDFDSPISPSDWVLGKFDAAQMQTLNSVISNLTV
ncbi:MAG: aminoacyl-tRNA hydrolase [Proteobacteria bacterium]|nr:aminoacyl-tRNA hydrolase [Candidatus Enterousia scatequi]